MKHLYIRKAVVMATRTVFAVAGLLAIWLMGGIAESPDIWWIYALASFGAGCAALLILGFSIGLEEDLAADIADYKAVPVRKIKRRKGA